MVHIRVQIANSFPSQPTHSPTLHRKTFTRSTSPAAGKMSRNPSDTSHATSGAQGPPTHQGPPYPRAIDFENTQNSTSNPSGQYVGNPASGGNIANNATSGQSYPSEGAGHSSSSSNSNQNANSGTESSGSNPLIFGGSRMGPYPYGNSNSGSNPSSDSTRANPGTQGK